MEDTSASVRSGLGPQPSMATAERPESSAWSRLAASLWGSLPRSHEPLPGRYRSALLVLLLASFALRLGISWRLPNIHHPDEVYMVAEQAYRSIHGYGIVPWEFRNASRPAALATFVWPIYRLNVSPAAHRVLQAGLFCVLSLIPVWVAYAWTARVFGLRAAVLAAVMMATWFELVYFAPKGTVDAVCAYILLAGVFLARPGASRRAVFMAGASLMFTLALRVQVAPAVGLVFVLAAIVGGRVRTAALVLGGVAGLMIAGTIEWLWYGSPFQGQRGYLLMEFGRQASSYFGSQPFGFYVKQYILMYGLALPLVAYLVVAGARTAPVLLIAALAVIVPFHLVDHKEYRFVVAALPMVVLLMGFAAAGVLARWEAASKRGVLPLLLGAWIVSMLAVSWGDTYRPLWTKHRNHVFAFEDIGADPAACGVGLVNIGWGQTPGYSGLGRNIPIYEILVGRTRTITSDEQIERIRLAATYLLQAPKTDPPPAPYVRWREYTRPVQSLYRRPGGCIPDAALQVIRPPGPDIPGIE